MKKKMMMKKMMMMKMKKMMIMMGRHKKPNALEEDGTQAQDRRTGGDHSPFCLNALASSEIYRAQIRSCLGRPED